MIRKIAMLLLAAAAGYVAWVIVLNLPGNSGPSSSAAPPARMASGPVKATELVRSGPLVVPVAGISAAELGDTFDDARGEGRVHDAIDIMAARGRAVLAAADGRVEKLFWSEDGGRTLYQRSSDGRLIYYYAHLDGYAAGLHEGQSLKRGQPIATVGSTGNADPSAPHLHFAVTVMQSGEPWHGGRSINPNPLLVRR
jgi:murein DD-endopeptidase MepM/ murein hydrolase activator NlpD